MYKVLLGFYFFSFIALANVEINKTLDNFHQAAARADHDTYLGLMADDAIYLGTDSSERWTKQQFSSFVEPYFSKGVGWLYRPVHRNITKSGVENIAFFDELLDNDNYGRCRGTGVVIKTSHGWKILQYNLSIPVPNAIANNVVDTIQLFRQEQTK
jgi:ketosteroid isomerase-like protein